MQELPPAIEKILFPDGAKSLLSAKETLVRTVFLHAKHSTGDKRYHEDLENLKNMYFGITEMQQSS